MLLSSMSQFPETDLVYQDVNTHNSRYYFTHRSYTSQPSATSGCEQGAKPVIY